MSNRPEIVEDEHLIFLRDLRTSGTDNMWGANKPLAKKFGLSQRDAQIVHMYWMDHGPFE